MGTVHALALTGEHQNRVSQNRDSGFMAMYRSLRWAPWARHHPERKAFFVDCLLQAQHTDGQVFYRGKEWPLKRGQLVICASEVCAICGFDNDRAGRKKAERLIGWFIERGMLAKVSSRDGYVLQVCRYDDYQQFGDEQDGENMSNNPAETSKNSVAPDVAENVAAKASNHAGSEGDHVADDVAPNVGQNNNVKNNNVIDINSSSQNANATADAALPEAAVQTPGGKYWGTAEDLQAAQWMFGRVQQINATAKTPQWPQWANTVRLIRTMDGRSHREICELFDFANRDAFWCANVLSPTALRKHWDKLTTQRSHPRHNGNDPQSLAARREFARHDTSWMDNLEDELL